MLATIHMTTVFMSLLLPDEYGRLLPATRVHRAEEKQISLLLTSKDWHPVLKIEREWIELPLHVRLRLAKKLCPALHSNALVGLLNTADLIIPYRVKTGEMRGLGMGLCSFQDLYLRGGRAAWAISSLIDDDQFPILDGGLTPGEWNERALKIEARVKDFAAEAAKPKKPPVPLTRIRSWSAPHIVPAVNGILAARHLLALSDDPWPAPRAVVMMEEKLIREFLATPDWNRLREIREEFRGGERPEAAKARTIARLLPVLRDTTRVPVEGADDLLLPNRIASGELKASPARVFDARSDVFLKGGRAAFALGHLQGWKYDLHGGMSIDEWNKQADRIEKDLRRTLDGIDRPKKK